MALMAKVGMAVAGVTALGVELAEPKSLTRKALRFGWHRLFAKTLTFEATRVGHAQ